MNKDHFTSLELSKKLKDNGCRLKTPDYWFFNSWNGGWELNIAQIDHKFDYPAFDILNDLCIKYAIEVFDDKHLWDQAHMTFQLMFMKQNAGAEEYLWRNCKFNPENPENNKGGSDV